MKTWPRRHSIALFLIPLAGCSTSETWTDAIPHYPTDPGWHYRAMTRAQMVKFGFGTPATKSLTAMCGYVSGPDLIFFAQEVLETGPTGELVLTAGDTKQTFEAFPEFHSGNLIVNLKSGSDLYRKLRTFRGSLHLSVNSGHTITFPPTDYFIRLTRACDDMRVRFADEWAKT